MLSIECASCERLGVSCAGPQFIAMEPAELTSWIRRRKAVMGLTIDDIAARAGVSPTTINRMLSGTWTNYRLESVSPILQVLLGGSWPALSCAAETGQEMFALRDRVHHLEGELSATRDSAGQLHESAQDNADALRAQIAQLLEQIDQLRRQLARYRHLAYALGIALFLGMFAMILLLLYDLSNGNVGYFLH